MPGDGARHGRRRTLTHTSRPGLAKIGALRPITLHALSALKPLLPVRSWLFALALWGLFALGTARAEGVVHQGPVLDIQVQRGDQVLPLLQVPHLQMGDELLVRPDPESLAEGRWILMLGLISPAGNQVRTRAVDPADLQEPARLEITADDQAPVIVLAPQLRNLFGLYTSFRESSALLDDIIQSDPQRFYDLQRLDEVNQAISALAQGLDDALQRRTPAESIAATRVLAQTFGVSQVDPECFRNNSVNTQCVAINIVANKDFVLPAASELGLLAGAKGAADLTGFLADKLKVFSSAGDFLSNKFRDQYDFAATFGRRWRDSSYTQLFSLTRFRKGNIKTAYVYVPASFKGNTPQLQVDSASPLCLSRGLLPVRARERMPVLNPWHSWRLVLRDPDSGAPLTDTRELWFSPARSQLSFTPPAVPAGLTRVQATVQGQFGFEPIELPPFTLVLPPSDLAAQLQGADTLIAGEQAELRLDAASQACVQALRLSQGEQVLARSSAEAPGRLAIDLRGIPPGPVTLTMEVPGAAPAPLTLRVQAARAQVRRVEHTELDAHLVVLGQGLERIERAELGSVPCTPQRTEATADGLQRLLLACDGDVRSNDTLPNHVTLHHVQGEPGAMVVPLRKNLAAPRVRLAPGELALLVRPSAKALRWGLDHRAAWLANDSALNLLLQASEGYRLVGGGYSLQLRYADDPASQRTPLQVPLMVDLKQQALRTREPVNLQALELPTVVNPLEYRVVQNNTGLASEWTALQRSVLMLPEFSGLVCASAAPQWWLRGRQLDLVQALGWSSDALTPAQAQTCPDGLCLLLPLATAAQRLWVQLQWLPEPLFQVDLGATPNCP